MVAAEGVATGPVFTTDKREDDNRHDHDGGDDRKYLHPARSARGRGVG